METKTEAIKLIHLPDSEVEDFRNLKKIKWDKVPGYNGIQKCHVWQSRLEKNKIRLYTARTANHTLQKVFYKKQKMKKKTNKQRKQP